MRALLSALDSNDLIVRHGDFGIAHGEIWLDERGSIIAINSISPRERALQQRLINRVQSRMHPSVRRWISDVLVCQCSRYTLRVDYTDQGLRLATWKRRAAAGSRPIRVVYGGMRESYGTQGGYGYVFTDRDLQYRVEEIEMCETPNGCGLFLEIARGESILGRYRCRETKGN